MAERKSRKPTREVVVLRTKDPKSSQGVPKSSVGELYTPLKTGDSDYEPTEPCVSGTDSDYEPTEPYVGEIYTPMKTVNSDYQPTKGHNFKPGQRLFPMAVPNTYTQKAGKHQNEVEDSPEDDYEPVSVYENVCDFVETRSKEKTWSKPRAVGGSEARETERPQDQRRQLTHEMVVLPTTQTHKTWEENGDYTPLKTIRHTPGTYEHTQFLYEDEDDEYENVEVPIRKR